MFLDKHGSINMQTLRVYKKLIQTLTHSNCLMIRTQKKVSAKLDCPNTTAKIY